MTLLELIDNYGPVVLANPELGIIIQRNGAYMNLGREDRNGWSHVECRAVETDGYNTTMAQAIDEAEAWLKELLLDEEE
jgi:hypothetical protein